MSTILQKNFKKLLIIFLIISFMVLSIDFVDFYGKIELITKEKT